MPSLRRVLDPFDLLDPVADALTRTGLTLLERALASEAAVEAVELIVRSPPAARAARATAELLDDPATTRLLDRALASPRVAELLDVTVARLLASEAVWLAVDEIAQSPAVATAIARQGEGFADQVADELGERTRWADARLERATRRLLRRRSPPATGPGPFAPPQAP